MDSHSKQNILKVCTMKPQYDGDFVVTPGAECVSHELSKVLKSAFVQCLDQHALCNVMLSVSLGFWGCVLMADNWLFWVWPIKAATTTNAQLT